MQTYEKRFAGKIKNMSMSLNSKKNSDCTSTKYIRFGNRSIVVWCVFCVYFAFEDMTNALVLQLSLGSWHLIFLLGPGRPGKKTAEGENLEAAGLYKYMQCIVQIEESTGVYIVY